jgi:UDP-GlcNAc:undecaprenyl-phosphate GlcNAc-1-phosphate transferase
MNADLLSLYLQSLPVALASSFLAFYISGVYRGIWRYIDFDELARFAQASLGAVVLMGAIIFISSATDLLPWKNDFPRLVLVLFGLFLVLGLAGTRLSFRALDRLSGAQSHENEQAVLIYGAGDAGEMALRWIQANPHSRMRPVGFLDDDPLLLGRRIHGVEVLGGQAQLKSILKRKKVVGLILAQDDGGEKALTTIRVLCQESGCWVRHLRLDFELLAAVTDPVALDSQK